MNIDTLVDDLVEKIDESVVYRVHEGKKFLQDEIKEAFLKVRSLVYAEIAKAQQDMLKKSVDDGLCYVNPAPNAEQSGLGPFNSRTIQFTAQATQVEAAMCIDGAVLYGQDLLPSAIAHEVSESFKPSDAHDLQHQAMIIAMRAVDDFNRDQKSNWAAYNDRIAVRIIVKALLSNKGLRAKLAGSYHVE